MRIVLVEDEAVIARRLARMVREIVGEAEVEVVPTFDAALAMVRTRRFDVLLLDLDLGGRDGFAVLEEAAAGPFATVIVSAHHDQALRAFEYGVADFVAKPWTEERLRKALERAAGRRDGGGAGTTRRLAVRCGRELRTIPVATVDLVRGADDYSELHLADGTVHLHEKSLTALAALLPPSFARVHRSWLVNLDRVRALLAAPGGRRTIVLLDGREVPVGRVYRDAVLSLLDLRARPPAAGGLR